jgi:hypothetical protein
MMTDEKLQAIKARAEAATPGPWETREDSDFYQGGRYIGTGPYHYTTGSEKPGRPSTHPEDCYFKTDVCRVQSGEADETFIAHARTDVPALLAEVERLKAELVNLIGAIAQEAERIIAKYP